MSAMVHQERQIVQLYFFEKVSHLNAFSQSFLFGTQAVGFCSLVQLGLERLHKRDEFGLIFRKFESGRAQRPLLEREAGPITELNFT